MDTIEDLKNQIAALLEKKVAEAREEGYRDGWDDGHAEGYDTGYDDGAAQ